MPRFLLVAYWVTIFILAHIPIPDVVYRAQVSDKSIHMLAYLILTFLLWVSVGTTERVNWGTARVWWIIAAVVCYATADELLQQWAGRNCDVADFSANVGGMFGALGLLTFLSLRSALLVMVSTVVFVLANVARADLSRLLPVASVVFYAAEYVVLTAVWARYLAGLVTGSLSVKRLLAMVSFPAAMIAAVEVFSVVIGRGLRPWRAGGSAAGCIICIAAMVLFNTLARGAVAARSERPI